MAGRRPQTIDVGVAARAPAQRRARSLRPRACRRDVHGIVRSVPGEGEGMSSSSGAPRKSSAKKAAKKSAGKKSAGKKSGAQASSSAARKKAAKKGGKA